jgi:hypothetical protein
MRPTPSRAYGGRSSVLVRDEYPGVKFPWPLQTSARRSFWFVFIKWRKFAIVRIVIMMRSIRVLGGYFIVFGPFSARVRTSARYDRLAGVDRIGPIVLKAKSGLNARWCSYVITWEEAGERFSLSTKSIT